MPGRPYRRLFSDHLPRFQRSRTARFHSPPACLTVSVGKSVSKERAIDLARSSLSELLSKAPPQSCKHPHAAVILASRTLASWLEDEAFVSGLLEPLRATSPQTVDVLGAVVDHVASSGESDRLYGGFSLLHGEADTLLPKLWNPDPEYPAAESSLLPSMTFSRLPWGSRSSPVDITLPLATTLFDNGKPYTIFASRWQDDNSTSFRLSKRVDKVTQRVGIPGLDESTGHIQFGLRPITRARKIASGLGNIVRQLEGDAPSHKPVPASGELEALIPKILAALEASGRVPVSGPIGVWALVIPEQVAGWEGDIPEGVEAGTLTIPHILSSGGRMCKILSGGGGWGAKQGLLSLDPQTKYTSPDQDDVESFARAFLGEDSAGDTGVIRPGSYIQFFIQSHPVTIQSNKAINNSAKTPLPQLQFEAQDGAESDATSTSSEHDDHAVSVAVNLFGATSCKGIYVASSPRNEQGLKICTKIDADQSAYICTLGEPAGVGAI